MKIVYRVPVSRGSALYNRINAFVKEHDMTRAELFRRAVREFLDQHKTHEDKAA